MIAVCCNVLKFIGWFLYTNVNKEMDFSLKMRIFTINFNINIFSLVFKK